VDYQCQDEDAVCPQRDEVSEGFYVAMGAGCSSLGNDGPPFLRIAHSEGKRWFLGGEECFVEGVCCYVGWLHKVRFRR